MCVNGTIPDTQHVENYHGVSIPTAHLVMSHSAILPVKKEEEAFHLCPGLPYTSPDLGDLLCELPPPCLLAFPHLHPNLLLDISSLNTYPSSATSLHLSSSSEKLIEKVVYHCSKAISNF